MKSWQGINLRQGINLWLGTNRLGKYRIVAAVLAVVLCAPLCQGCGLVKSAVRQAAGQVREKIETVSDGEEYISQEAKIYNEAVDDFFEALDQRDGERILEMFAPNVRKETPDLAEKVEELLEAYPGPTDICKRDGSMVSGSYSNDHGIHTSEVTDGFPVVSGSRYYWCDLTLMYENDEDADEIGIQKIRLCSPEYRCEESYNPPDRSGMMDKSVGIDQSPLQVKIECDVDYEVRFVGGYPKKFTPVDRDMTVEQAEEFLKRDYRYSKFLEKFGPPNVESTSGVACSYELRKEENEPRYLDLIYDDEKDQILSASVVNGLDDGGERVWELEE